jgi:HK97 family phage portal protein
LFFFNRLFGGKEKRSSDAVEHFLTGKDIVDLINETISDTGEVATSDTAVREAAVMACTRVLSESVAQLPLQVYQRNGRSKKIVRQHPLYYLLHDAPNNNLTSFSFRETGQASLCLRGNTYAFVEYDAKGEIIALHPIFADRIRPFSYTKTHKSYSALLPKSKVAFEYKTIDGKTEIFLSHEVLSINGLSFNGLFGLNPIAAQRETVELAMLAKKFGTKLFLNGAHIKGVIEHPQKLDKPAFEKLKDSWNEAFSGVANSHKTAILEQGAKYNQIAMTSKDAQWLELRKYQRSDIAGFYRVPLHMINDLERATFSNIEHQSSAFVVHSLTPWLKRWEQPLNQKLLTPDERRNQGLFVEFNVDGLLRGDSEARSNFYASGITNGWLTRNEVRERENLNPMDGGDELLVPLNMQAVGSEDKEKDSSKDSEEENAS